MATRGRMILGLTLSLAGAAWAAGEATRYQQLCRKARGSHGAFRVQAATCLGGSGPEELMAAGFMPDGSVLVAGNAWEPDFLAAAHAARIGPDQYAPGEPYLPARKKGQKGHPPETERQLNPDDPNRSGFLVRFSPSLDRVLGAVRFGWGSATITHAEFGPDGAAYVSGKCSPNFENWLDGSGRLVHTVPAPERGGGADLYLARILPGAKGLDWVVLLPGAERSALAQERAVDGRAGLRAFPRGDGTVEFAAHGRLWLRDEHGPHELGRHRDGVLLAVDPKDGAAYVGGEESVRAGLGSRRRPFLSRYDREGRLAWQVWNGDVRRVKTDRKQLETDAGMRGLLQRSDGSFLLHGWSSRCTSVFDRQPTDLDSPFRYPGFLEPMPDADTGHYSRLMVLRPDAQQLIAATDWAAFSPDRDQPASATIDGMALLPGNLVGLVGNAGNALIESRDAWAPAFPLGAGGSYLALFSADLKTLRFSSLLPGVRGPLGIAARGDRLAVIGNTPAGENRTRLPWPPGGFQRKPGGGQDGVILVVKTGLLGR